MGEAVVLGGYTKVSFHNNSDFLDAKNLIIWVNYLGFKVCFFLITQNHNITHIYILTDRNIPAGNLIQQKSSIFLYKYLKSTCVAGLLFSQVSDQSLSLSFSVPFISFTM